MYKVKELNVARIERGYTLEEVSERLGIGFLALREYETNPEIIPVSVACEILKFYRLGIDEINFSETI